jgi:hypothetical protein
VKGFGREVGVKFEGGTRESAGAPLRAEREFRNGRFIERAGKESGIRAAGGSFAGAAKDTQSAVKASSGSRGEGSRH